MTRSTRLATVFRAAFMAALLVALSVQGLLAQTAEELFDPSVLHDIHLTMKADDWSLLRQHYMEDTYYRADLHWRDLVVPIVGVRSRGSGSRNPGKPGLKIAFDRYLDQKPFGLKSLVLANAIQDPAMLKQRLGLLMFARMDMPAPRVVHARLFVNDEYVGLYEIIEPIEKAFLARVFDKDADGKAENGGYLYEYQWKDAYAFDYPGRDYRIYSELFEAKSHEEDAPALLYGPLEELFRTFNEVSQDQFEDEVNPRLDLRTFVQHLAVENFIAEHDGFLGAWGPNNFYLYRFQGRQLSQLLPWDKDEAFWDRYYDIFQGVDDNVLARRTLAVPSLYRLYLETLLACAARAMEQVSPDSTVGWLEAEVLNAIAQIHAAGSADTNKRFSNDRFDDELEKVLHFARERGPYVSREAARALARMGSNR